MVVLKHTMVIGSISNCPDINQYIQSERSCERSNTIIRSQTWRSAFQQLSWLHLKSLSILSSLVLSPSLFLSSMAISTTSLTHSLSTVITFGGMLFILSSSPPSSISLAVTSVVTPPLFRYSPRPISPAETEETPRGKFREEAVLSKERRVFCWTKALKVEALSLDVIQCRTRTLKRTTCERSGQHYCC